MVEAKVIADMLNHLLRLQPKAAAELASYRVVFADQVAIDQGPRLYVNDMPGTITLSIVDILNSLVEPYDRLVTAIYDDKGSLLGFAIVGNNNGGVVAADTGRSFAENAAEHDAPTQNRPKKTQYDNSADCAGCPDEYSEYHL